MAAVTQTPAAAVPAAAPATAPAAEAGSPFGTLWNSWVNGVFSRVVTQLDFSSTFSLTLEDAGEVKADSTAKKIVKMVALFIPMLALSVFALVGSALSTVKACFCGKGEEAKKEGETTPETTAANKSTVAEPTKNETPAPDAKPAAAVVPESTEQKKE